MRYFVVDKRGRAVAGFYPNDNRVQIDFSRLRRGVRSAPVFDTPEKAQTWIDEIRAECNEKTAAIAATLRPSLYAVGFEVTSQEEIP